MPKIQILTKNRSFFTKIRKGGQKSKLWHKIEILLENRNFGRKFTFVSKIFSQDITYDICIFVTNSPPPPDPIKGIAIYINSQ